MFHLRFTPYDISGYTFDFLGNYDRFIVAQEDVEDDGTPLLHYHILIDTDYGVKSIRDALKASLQIPPAGRGKNNRYYALIPDWKDPGYICKYNQVLRVKGFSEKEIMEFVISGKQKYLTKLELSPDVPAGPAKKLRVYWDKEVVADAITFYELAKKEGREPTRLELVKEVNRLTRVYGKLVNKFKTRDLVYTVLHDSGGSEWIAQKCLEIL